MFFSSSLPSFICQHLYKFYKQYLSARVVISVSSCFLCYFRLCNITFCFAFAIWIQCIGFGFVWFLFLFVSVSEFIVLFAILFDFLFQKAKPTTKLVQEHRCHPISEIVANCFCFVTGNQCFSSRFFCSFL